MVCKTTATIFAACLAVGTAHGVELKIGMSETPTTMGPHYHNLRVNNEVLHHVFEALSSVDKKGSVRPLLAKQWTALDDTTWKFELRQDVMFHDGGAFTANDFIYTACRVDQVADSPSPFTLYTRAMASIEAADPYTLIIKTAAPHPSLPGELSKIGILSARANGADGELSYPSGCATIAAWPQRREFDTGERAIGTGQFTFAGMVANDTITLVRNRDYWASNSTWERMIFRTILDSDMRTAALLAREVDFIATPAAAKIPWLEFNGSFTVDGGTSSRMVYLQFDHRDGAAAGLTGTEGRNPFADRRVRAAVAHAIDRNAIVAQIGQVAAPAIGLAPAGTLGDGATTGLPAFDPAAAEALLTAAGYPRGFGLALAVPNDRDADSIKLAQTIAGMLGAVGIATTLDTMSSEEFFQRRGAQGFGLFVGEWDAGAGELAPPLRALLATPDAELGLGGTNHGRYSNPRYDALVRKAMTTADSEERGAYLTAANALAMEDVAMVPLYHEVMTWANRWMYSVDRRINDPKLSERVVACAHFCHGNSTRHSAHALRLLHLDIGANAYGH